LFFKVEKHSRKDAAAQRKNECLHLLSKEIRTLIDANQHECADLILISED